MKENKKRVDVVIVVRILEGRGKYKNKTTRFLHSSEMHSEHMHINTNVDV